MNERMQYLVSQAQEEVWENNPYNGSPIFERYELNLEQLTTLIVLDCTNIVQKYMSRSSEDHDLTKQIKQHFGVTND